MERIRNAGPDSFQPGDIITGYDYDYESSPTRVPVQSTWGHIEIVEPVAANGGGVAILERLHSFRVKLPFGKETVLGFPEEGRYAVQRGVE